VGLEIEICIRENFIATQIIL